MTEANETPGQYWLITYQSKKSDARDWRTANHAINCTPADWLLDRLTAGPSLTYDTVLLSAIPISETEYYRLQERI